MLDKQLRDLQIGTSNVPALLLNTPQASLDSLNLGRMKFFQQSHYMIWRDIYILLRKSSRKHVVKPYKSWNKYRTQSLVNALWDVRITERLWSWSTSLFNNPPTQMPRLWSSSELLLRSLKLCMPQIQNEHQEPSWDSTTLVYQHGKVCSDLFVRDATKHPVLGCYFHSITCHAPLLLWIICLRSVHTEMQEHMFGQAKQITKTTSSLKANHVITNFLIRVHEQATAEANPLMTQDGEIHNLAQALHRYSLLMDIKQPSGYMIFSYQGLEYGGNTPRMASCFMIATAVHHSILRG